jgi:hypothetical protein
MDAGRIRDAERLVRRGGTESPATSGWSLVSWAGAAMVAGDSCCHRAVLHGSLLQLEGVPQNRSAKSASQETGQGLDCVAQDHTIFTVNEKRPIDVVGEIAEFQGHPQRSCNQTRNSVTLLAAHTATFCLPKMPGIISVFHHT